MHVIFYFGLLSTTSSFNVSFAPCPQIWFWGLLAWSMNSMSVVHSGPQGYGSTGLR